MIESQQVRAASERAAVHRFRLAALTSHPIQYQAPLFQHLANEPAIDLTVYFGSDAHYGAAQLDKDFGTAVAWDRPLLEGYRSRFLSQEKRDRPAGARMSAYFRLIRELLRQRYDGILLSGYNDMLSLAGYMGAWASATPVLLRAESELLRNRPALVRFAKRLLLPVLLRGTGACLAIGTANRRFFRHYGVGDGAIFDAPYCVDNHFFLSSREQLTAGKETLKQELGFPPDLPLVVFSGKLIDRKRPLDAVAAVARLAADGLKAGLLLVGDGPLRAEVERAAAVQKLENVRVAGFKNQTELPRYYGCGDIFVLPSDFETWGLVVNEAMLFAMPAVVSDMVGCGHDLVENGITGFTYPVGDVNRLASCLATLIRDPARREAMGREAESRVRRLSYAACSRGILQALEAASRRTRQHGKHDTQS